jgi:DNA-directed RNA polymerase specialized sigma24 family protein/transcriptional regulator with XRE-family HTH domain
MTDGKRWRTWDEIEAEAKADGRLDEGMVAAERKRMRAEQRAYRLAEIRRGQGLTQSDLAAAMGVSQRRVSAVERGILEKTEIGTVIAYITALGGKVEIVARFEDEQVTIADQVVLQGGEPAHSPIRPAASNPGGDAWQATGGPQAAELAGGDPDEEALQATDRLADQAEAELAPGNPDVALETAEHERARAERLRADQLLVEAVLQEGLGGPRHRVLEDALVRYAVPVLQHLLASGRVADMATRLHRPPTPQDAWLDFTEDDRQEFAIEMVASALPAFTRAVFEDRRWAPGHGASLRTYFVNACILQFARLQRQWLDHRQAIRPAGLEINPDAYVSAPDPADTVIKQDEVRRMLSQIEDEQLRELLMLRGAGWPAKEAAKMVGLTPRAAEGRLARLRRRLEGELAGTEPHAARAGRRTGMTAAEMSKVSNRDTGTTRQEFPEAEVDPYFEELLGASSVRDLAKAA